MFYKREDTGYREPIAGVAMKTLVHGDNTLFTEFRLKAGHLLPRHAHAQEQTGYLVAGALRLTIGAETFDVRPGDSWCIPGNVEHEVQVVEDSVAVEVFSPVRSDYLPQAQAMR